MMVPCSLETVRAYRPNDRRGPSFLLPRPAAGSMPRRRPRLSGRQVFLTVSLVDLAACHTLAGLGHAELIWLMNLPATIWAGRLAWLLWGEPGGLAVTIIAGAALYGWGASRAYTRALAERDESGRTGCRRDRTT